LYPDLTLPPEPIITRWGTWLSAVLYYSNNFEKIKNVVLNLDPEAAMAIKKTVELNINNKIDSKNLQNNLAFISTNFGFLVNTISKLETSKMPLTESLEIVYNAIKQLERVPGEIGVLNNSKLKNVLEKNTGFNTVMPIRHILLNKTPNNNYSEIEYTPKEIMCMKYEPVTSVDVERSFSRYKAMLRPNHRHFTFDNFKLYFVSNCFPHKDYDDSE
jgi:hypothetical protein